MLDSSRVQVRHKIHTDKHARAKSDEQYLEWGQYVRGQGQLIWNGALPIRRRSSLLPRRKTSQYTIQHLNNAQYPSQGNGSLTVFKTDALVDSNFDKQAQNYEESDDYQRQYLRHQVYCVECILGMLEIRDLPWWRGDNRLLWHMWLLCIQGC